MVGTLEKLKRALVVLIVSLARTYKCTVHVTRESSDEEVRSAYRKLSRHVHPDRPGGSTEDQKRLNGAQKTRRASSRFARGLFNVCKEVKAKRGAASRG